MLHFISQGVCMINSFPCMLLLQDEQMALQANFRRTPPREVIVFVVGGTTFEEAKAVADWNERNPHMRVLLGGSTVLNAKSFLMALTGSSTD
jgi:vacuolar protein sorting-associated protein 45